jgi:cell division protein FtsN
VRPTRHPRQRPRSNPRPHNSARGGTLLGIFIGLVMGLALAAGVAYYLGRSGFTTPPAAGPAKEPPRAGKSDTTPIAATPDKPRFDFYKILPGGEEPKAPAERKAADKAPERPADKAVPDAVAKAADKDAPRPTDRLWLQAGAFASQSDAEDLRARLALSGWEAVIQTASLPDKTVRYRVRLGPYDNTDQLNRIKGDLGKGGFDVAVIRNP